MATRFSALLLATACLPLSGLLQAWPDELKTQPAAAADIYAAQGSFMEESTRTMSDGRVFRRKVEQKAEAGALARQEVVTTADGKSASYSLSRTYDAVSERWMLSEEGAGFDGKRWSRSQTGEPERLVFGDVPKAAVLKADATSAEKPAAPATPAGGKRREFR